MESNYNKEIEIAKKAIQIACRNGADAARAMIDTSTSNMYSVANGELERLQRSDDRSLGIQLYYKGRYGLFSTNRLNLSSVEKFITESLAMVRFLTQDNCRSLPDSRLYFKGVPEDLGQFDPYILEMPDSLKKEIVFKCYDEIAGKDKKLIYANSKYEDNINYQYIIDTQGFEGDSIQSDFTILMECSIEGENGSKPDSYWYESSLLYKEFKPEGCAKKSLERAKAKLCERKIKGGKFNVIFDNTCSSRIIGPILNALDGMSIQQQSSFLKESKGKKIFSEKLTITDNPHQYGMSGSRYFDNEGIATKPMNIIENGIITDYYINSYVSKKMEMEVTIDGPSVPSISKDPFSEGLKDIDMKEIMKKIGDGILITGINGGNCNDSTGDFSFGIEGQLFKEGEILHPVREMNITGNIIKFWDNFIMAGNDARKCSNWQIPSLAFENASII